MNNVIYVGHLPFNTKEEELRKFFAHCGDVTSIEILTEENSERQLGYAFITFADEKSAQKAVDEMDGKKFNDRLLKVQIREEHRCKGRWE